MVRMRKFLRSVQLDHWSFGGLQKVGVVSHTHIDHDPTAAQCTFVPEEIFVHDLHYSSIRDPTRTTVKAVSPRRGRRISGRVYGYPLLADDLRRAFNITPPGGYLHSAWWIFREGNRTAIFIGELDASEVNLIPNIVEIVKPAVIILPSYGGIKDGKHRTSHPDELANKVARIAEILKDSGISVWGLPHPVTPPWADEIAHKIC